MLKHTHYVPILKGKLGELNAIESTAAELRQQFIPLIEIPPITPKYIEGEDEPIPSKSIDAHIRDVAKKFAKAIGKKYPAFLDGLYIENDATLPEGLEPISWVFNALRKDGILFIPVVGLDRVEEYGEAIRTTISKDGRGCCLRIWESDLEADELDRQIAALLKFLKVGPPDVDLLLDFGPNVPSRAALPLLIDALPFLGDWRSLIVASSSFPTDMRDITQNTIAEFERREWTAWTSLRAKKTVKRMPSFGDYAINHPELSEIDPRFMAMSPNIRYTGPINFVVAKGAAYPRKKDKKKDAARAAVLAAKEQYPKLAKMVMAHPSWAGEKFSWGDAFIAGCSRKERVGNPTDWRAVGTSHHIVSVVRQIASLP